MWDQNEATQRIESIWDCWVILNEVGRTLLKISATEDRPVDGAKQVPEKAGLEFSIKSFLGHKYS